MLFFICEGFSWLWAALCFRSEGGRLRAWARVVRAGVDE